MTPIPLLQHLEEAVAPAHNRSAGLFLDIDGTLSEIVPLPHEATISPAIRTAVATLASRLALVCIVTGRPAANGKSMLGLDELTYVGNHGMEWIQDGRVFTDRTAAPYEADVERVLEAVKEQCGRTDAIIEEKACSFAVHYRNSADPQAIEHMAMQAIEQQNDCRVRVLTGKAHINVLPPVTVNKGTAVRSLVQSHKLGWALIAGDDVTDIDAFREARDLAASSDFRCTNVAVLGEDCPAGLLELADYTLASVGEMERFLDWWAGQAEE